ncbi:MAG: hypothetical protein O7D95_03070 [Betaproteobacteria bacterium]|nr:hypothetical protein [Betaproteobacteria bacterium]
MIEEPIEKSLDFIRNNAGALAKAKAERIYMDEYRKSLKAILYQKAPQGTIADREAWAYSEQDYLDHLKALQTAVEEEERLKWLMVAAQCKIEVWRSQNASARFIDKVHT